MIFERLKILYETGKIKDLSNYVNKGLITEEQYTEITEKAYK